MARKRTKIGRLRDKVPKREAMFQNESVNKCAMGRPFMLLTIVSRPKT